MIFLIKIGVGVGIIFAGQAISSTFHCGVITGILIMGAYLIIDVIAKGLKNE